MLADLRESGLQAALDKFKTSVIKQARTNLTKGDRNVSRKLYNSLKGEAKVYAKGIRPTLFFTKPFESAYKRLPQELVNDLKIDLEKIFNYSIKQPK